LRRARGYIGPIVDYEYEGEDEEDYCPACARLRYTSKLSRKIIYVEQGKISKNPLFDLCLDPEKEYRQCRECGNIYDLNDLPATIMQDPDPEQEEINRAYRQGDYIPGPGAEIKNKKSKRKKDKSKDLENVFENLDKVDLPEPKIVKVHRKIVKKKPVPNPNQNS
jgi:hypothetical protein